MFLEFNKRYWEANVAFGIFPTVEFVASIKYNKIIPDCQTWLDGNILISPNDPKINCSWIINLKLGSYLTLDFRYIEVMNFIMAKNIDTLYYNS